MMTNGSKAVAIAATLERPVKKMTEALTDLRLISVAFMTGFHFVLGTSSFVAGKMISGLFVLFAS